MVSENKNRKKNANNIHAYSLNKFLFLFKKNSWELYFE